MSQTVSLSARHAHDVATRIVNSRDREEVNQLLYELYPYIHQVSRIHARRHGLDDEEFAADCFAHVGMHLSWKVCKVERRTTFDPRRGKFSTWFGKVVSHHALRRARQATQRREVHFDREGSYHEPPPVLRTVRGGLDDLLRIDWLLDRNEQLPDDDRETLVAWPNPRRRLVLLALSGVCDLVADGDWRRWQRAAGVRGGDLRKALADFDSPQERQRPLAKRLGMPPNTVSKQWSRESGRLLELHVVWTLVRDTFGMLSQAQTDQIATWPVAARVVVLAASGNWMRLPHASLWVEWCQELEVPAPWPLLRINTTPRRLAWLADNLPKQATRLEPHSVTNIWQSQHWRLAVIDGPQAC